MLFFEKFNKSLWAISIIGIIANLFDLITTYLALKIPTVYEANPFMAILFSYPLIGYPFKLIVGTWIFLPIKYTFYHLMVLKLRNNPLWSNINLILLLIAWSIGIYYFFKVGFINLSHII